VYRKVVKLLFVGNAYYIRRGKDASFNKILTEGALELSLFANKRKVLEI
jgi:hypothetical protein